MPPKTIFISHSTADDAHVDRIATALQDAGYAVWIDHHHMKTGDPSWDRVIRQAIANADVGVFVMSEASLASDICGSECLLLRDLKKPLYVLRLEACATEHIWLYIRQIHYADLTIRFEAGIKSLLDALGGTTDTTAPRAFSAHITGRETMRLHLPYLSNPLRGREAELHQLQTLIGGHITQIVGIGGWGKSRLCAEIALAHANGAVWHRCSVTSRGHDVVELLRKHLALPEDASTEEIIASTAQSKPLVVIDNAEDIPPNSPTRADYVQLLRQLASHEVPIILTTRIVWDEFVPRKQFAPSPLPPHIATTLAQDFANSQSIALSSEKANALAQACRYHPRLIEFAVGQLQETPYDALHKRLVQVSHEDIQQAVDEVITKTLEQMHQQAQYGDEAISLLRNLTWLQDSFDIHAIRALKPSLIKNDDLLTDALAVLRRYQFLRYDLPTERYSLATLVREALGMPANPEVFGRYADFYIQRAHDIFRRLPPEHWNDYAHDMPNVYALGNLLAERIATKTVTEKDLERARWFAKNTIRFVSRRIEARAWGWTEMGLMAVRQIQTISTRQKNNLRRDEAFFLNNLGYVWSLRGDGDAALTHYEQALAIYRQVGDRSAQSLVLTNIGFLWSVRGDYHKALSYYDEALPLHQTIRDGHGVGMLLNNIGSAWSGLGDHAKALDFYQQTLAIRQEEGDKWGIATALTNLGKAWSGLGDHDKALTLLHQALPLRQAVGDKRGEAVTWFTIARVYATQGNREQAIASAQEAIRTTYPQDPSIASFLEFITQLGG